MTVIIYRKVFPSTADITHLPEEKVRLLTCGELEGTVCQGI
jgi:hypothetical protein